MSVANQEEDQGGGAVADEGRETIEVPPPPEPDDDDSPAAGGEPAAAAEAARSRKARRENHLREEKEAREAAERSVREAREENARLAREVSYIRGQMEARAQGDPAAELKARIDQLDDEAQAHLQRAALAAAAKDTEMGKREMKAYHAKMREASRLETRAEMEPEIERRIGEVQQSIPSRELNITAQRVAQEFPEAYTNQRFNVLTDQIMGESLKAGKQWSYELLRASAAEARKLLGTGGRAAPTEQQRKRFAGVPGGEGAGGDEGAVQVPWGPAEKKLAAKAYPNLDPAEAKAKWLGKMAEAKRRKEW